MTGGVINTGNQAGATLKQQLTTALYESAISTATNTATQSAINGDSFKEALKNQLVNTVVGSLSNIGAKQIGNTYHDGDLRFGVDGTGGDVLGKLTQLALHAGLGAGASALTGNDAASGAVSGVVGELTGDILKSNGVSKGTGVDISGLTAGISALLTGQIRGLDNNDIASNIYNGQRIGENAAEHNSYGAATMTGCALGGPIGCGAGAVADVVIIVGGAVATVYLANEAKDALSGDGKNTDKSTSDKEKNNEDTNTQPNKKKKNQDGEVKYSNEDKIKGQMKKRGWTEEQIKEAIKSGKATPTQGKKGPATRYQHPETGKEVTVDNTSGEVFQVGDDGFNYDDYDKLRK